MTGRRTIGLLSFVLSVVFVSTSYGDVVVVLL